MDVILLSRLQFAAAAMFHFLFVPLTLGLAFIVAIMETMYVVKKEEIYLRMTRFWGKLFVINFVIGVVTGLTLEFQFGTNWAEYSKFVGDVFGSLLAIEATAAFFLESTFLGLWIFGWNRVSPRLHAAVIWVVAIASTTSAFWILAANSFMQHPLGFEIDPQTGRAVLTSFRALVTNETVINAFLHTVFGSFVLSAFFVMGVSAWHLHKKQHLDFFSRSMRIGVYMALVFSVLEVAQGHYNGAVVAKIQPAKLAAMESHWETGTRVAQTLFLVPDPKNERNLLEIGKIPGALSLLAYHHVDAEVKGLKDFPVEDRPPVLISFISFRLMVGLGFLFPAIAALGFLLYGPESVVDKIVGAKRLKEFLLARKWTAWLFVLSIPLPYLALQMGWVLTEVGRQPWIVYGVLRTRDAVSQVPAAHVGLSLAAFILVYSALGVVNFYLLYRFAKKGPAAPDRKEA